MNPRTNKVMENRFNKTLQQLLMKKAKSKLSMTKQEYSLMIRKVEAAKEKTPRWRTEDQSKCLEKYDVLKVGRAKKLIVPVQTEGEVPRYFVHTKELFEILHQLHIRMNHGSANRMHNELKTKYKNITREIVRIYVKSCTKCVKKTTDRKTKRPKKRVARRRKLARAQIECTKMFPRGTGPYYDHLMIYHDYTTKYDIASPIESEDVDKIASLLSTIFTLFGKPDVLQSMKRGPFVKEIVKKLRILRPGIEIKPEEIKIESMLKNMRLVFPVYRNPKLADIGAIFTSWSFEIGDRMRGTLTDLMEGRMRQEASFQPNPYEGIFVRNLQTWPRWSHLTGYTLTKIKEQLRNSGGRRSSRYNMRS